MTDAMTTDPRNSGEAPRDPRPQDLVNRLTLAAKDEGHMMAAIMKRRIDQQGRFKDDLQNHAFAFAKSHKMSSQMAETVIRTQFEMVNGKSMKDYSSELIDKEKNLDPHVRREEGLRGAEDAIESIRSMKMPWYQSQDRQAGRISRELGITESGAKTIMRDEYKATTGRTLYDDAKAAERAVFGDRDVKKKDREVTRSDRSRAPMPR